MDDTGRTAWDVLIDMRPENIGWALDDLLAAGRRLREEFADAAS